MTTPKRMGASFMSAQAGPPAVAVATPDVAAPGRATLQAGLDELALLTVGPPEVEFVAAEFDLSMFPDDADLSSLNLKGRLTTEAGSKADTDRWMWRN